MADRALGIDAMRGREAAVRASARVPLDYRLGANASIARVRTLAADLGRLADAEAVLNVALTHIGARAGQLAEGAQWLDACIKRRPRDPVV
jgi:hypothetical protein